MHILSLACTIYYFLLYRIITTFDEEYYEILFRLFFFSFLLALRSKYFSQQHVLKHPQFLSLPSPHQLILFN
jgi:hypothetical protein